MPRAHSNYKKEMGGGAGLGEVKLINKCMKSISNDI